MSTEAPSTTESTTETQATAEGATPDEPLGEAGLAALKSEREARAAAEKAAKDALAKVKAFEDAQKTESERQSERFAEIERENADLKTAKLRAEVAEAKSDPTKGILIPASLLSGSTQEELEASADALIKFRGETAPQRLVVPNEGTSPSKQPTSEAEFAKELFARGD